MKRILSLILLMATPVMARPFNPYGMWEKIFGRVFVEQIIMGGFTPAGGGSPSFTLLNSANCVSVGTSGCTTVGITFVGTATLLVVGASYVPESPAPPITNYSPGILDSRSDGFTFLTEVSAPGTTVSVATAYASATTGHPWGPFTSGDTVTCATTSGTYVACMVFVFGGGSGTVDQQAVGASSSSATSLQPGSITPGHNNEVIVGICGNFSSGASWSITGSPTFTLPSSTNIPGSSGNYLAGALFYDIQTTATAANPTCSSGISAAQMAAFSASFQ